MKPSDGPHFEKGPLERLGGRLFRFGEKPRLARCPECQGRGFKLRVPKAPDVTVAKPSEGGAPRTATFRKVTCPLCHGSGSIPPAEETRPHVEVSGADYAILVDSWKKDLDAWRLKKRLRAKKRGRKV